MNAPADAPLHAAIEKAVAALEPQVVAWRRDFHANPELSNREFRTARIVAEHLSKLGLDFFLFSLNERNDVTENVESWDSRVSGAGDSLHAGEENSLHSEALV